MNIFEKTRVAKRIRAGNEDVTISLSISGFVAMPTHVALQNNRLKMEFTDEVDFYLKITNYRTLWTNLWQRVWSKIQEYNENFDITSLSASDIRWSNPVLSVKKVQFSVPGTLVKFEYERQEDYTWKIRQTIYPKGATPEQKTGNRKTKVAKK